MPVVRSQQEAGSAPLPATFTNIPSLVGAELLTGEEIPLPFQDHQFSFWKSPHESANVFLERKGPLWLWF